MKIIVLIFTILLSNLLTIGNTLANKDISNICSQNVGDITKDYYKVTKIVGTYEELKNAIKEARNRTNIDLWYEIIIKKGKYSLKEGLWLDTGNIIIRGETGNAKDVVLYGQGMKSGISHGFWVTDKNTVIGDLTIENVKNHAIQIFGEKDADNILIHNVNIYDTGEQMIKGSTSSNGKTSDNSIIQCSNFEYKAGVGPQYYIGGIDVHSAKNWIVRNNTFKNITSPEKRWAEHAIHFWTNSENTLVENNLIINSDRGIGFGMGERGHIGGIIRNNIIYHDNSKGDVGIGLENADGVEVINNTIYYENSYQNAIEYRFKRTNTIIKNNLTNKKIAKRNGGNGDLLNNITNANESYFKDIKNYDFTIINNDVIKQNVGANINKRYSSIIKHSNKNNNIKTNPSDSNNIKTNKIKSNKNNVSVKLPLIYMKDFNYKGGFTFGGTKGVSDLNYSLGKIALNEENNSLFISSHRHIDAIGEFKIPSLIISEDSNDLNKAEQTQEFVTYFDRTNNTEKLDETGGMQVIGDNLIINSYEYYDAPADNKKTTAILKNKNSIKDSKINGMFGLQGRAHTALWISAIPEEWQNQLGGDYLAGGSSAMPINSRSSLGPSAFSFKSTDLLNHTNPDIKIPTNKLLDFDLKHILASNEKGWMPFSEYKNKIQYNYAVKIPANTDYTNEYDKKLVGNNILWTSKSSAWYGFIIPGTSTYATFGTSGMSESGGGYKIRQKNGNLCGGPCSYDPKDSYNYIWLWNVNDLVDVKNGVKKSYEVKPYEYGKFKTPFTKGIQGGAFDSKKGILYLTLPGAHNRGKYSNYPIIIAYTINGANNKKIIDPSYIKPKIVQNNYKKIKKENKIIKKTSNNKKTVEKKYVKPKTVEKKYYKGNKNKIIKKHIISKVKIKKIKGGKKFIKKIDKIINKLSEEKLYKLLKKINEIEERVNIKNNNLINNLINYIKSKIELQLIDFNI